MCVKKQHRDDGATFPVVSQQFSPGAELVCSPFLKYLSSFFSRAFCCHWAFSSSLRNWESVRENSGSQSHCTACSCCCWILVQWCFPSSAEFNSCHETKASMWTVKFSPRWSSQCPLTGWAVQCCKRGRLRFLPFKFGSNRDVVLY